jgi:hypothetical protein
MRICPNPTPWNDVYQKLKSLADSKAELPAPPVPLILNGWVYTNDLEKKQRWNETLEWAKAAGCISIVEALSESDYYFAQSPSDYQIGPMGGPMYLDWNFEKKNKPTPDQIVDALELLKEHWSGIAENVAEITCPQGFGGSKKRRLIVNVIGSGEPPWGSWDSLSVDDKQRRTFTKFRSAVNDAIKPLEVDHIDFIQKSNS